MTMTTTAPDSPLVRMVQATPTDYWDDSCAVASYHDLQGVVRDIILPNPDVRAG